jgi:hypothetical protein
MRNAMIAQLVEQWLEKPWSVVRFHLIAHLSYIRTLNVPVPTYPTTPTPATAGLVIFALLVE